MYCNIWNSFENYVFDEYMLLINVVNNLFILKYKFVKCLRIRM